MSFLGILGVVAYLLVGLFAGSVFYLVERYLDHDYYYPDDDKGMSIMCLLMGVFWVLFVPIGIGMAIFYCWKKLLDLIVEQLKELKKGS